MSRYFARLAQRTGLTAARNISNAAARADTGADIVEQEHYVEAPALASETRSRVDTTTTTASRSDRNSGPTDPTSKTATADRTAETSMASTTRPVSIGAPNVEHAAAAPIAATDKPTAANLGSALTFSPRNPSSRQPAVASDASLTPARDEPPSVAPTPSADERPVSVAARTSVPAREPSHTRVAVHERAPSAWREERFARHQLGEPSSIVASESPLPSDFTLPHEPRSSRSAAAVARAVTKSGAGRAAVEKNVEVRIGAVRLEVHTPSPPAPSAPTPPSAPAPAPRRFTPSRYHLRG